MTILEKGCQGKATWLPLYYDGPRSTPHGLLRPARFRPVIVDHWLECCLPVADRSLKISLSFRYCERWDYHSESLNGTSVPML